MALPLLLSLLSGCGQDPVAGGADLYAQTCQNCHGADGTAGVQLNGFPAADLTVWVPKLSDDVLRGVIRDGYRNMPPQDLTDPEIDSVIVYLRATFPD